MLEYVFFHPTPFEQFVAFVREQGLEPETGSDDESYEVCLPEDIDDALSERIEQRYDALMELNQALFEAGQGEGADNYHAAGVVLNLKDGKAIYADVPPRLLARIMEVLSAEEFGEVVNAIVDAVEAPDERTFCRRMRDLES
ncbi:MAG: hypothetical protein KDI82_03490 [Gammaproteobacteria bacterium]|nr:hypothetical protein [Gammaproteobacteria bacterium]